MEAALDKALANPGMGLLLLDEVNRGLAEDVEQLRQEVATMQEVHNSEYVIHKRNTHYVDDMSQMLDNLQGLVTTLRKDIESESKSERAASSESEGILRQCRLKHSELANVQETSELLQSRLTQRQREFEDMQKTVVGDSSLLKELLDHLAEADNDNLLLLQYSAEDASKIKELSVELERTSGKVAAAEAELGQRQSEASAARTVLEQLGTAFLQAASQRDHLLAQWEATLDHIYQAAKSQTQFIEDSLATQQKIGMLVKEVEQENEIFKQIDTSRLEVLTALQKVEEEEVWLNTQYKAVVETKEQIQSQLWALQNAFTKLNKDIENQQTQFLEKCSYREEKEALVASMEQQCSRAEHKLTLNTELVCSVEDNINSLQVMLKDGEALVRGLIKQKERVMEAEQHHLQAVGRWKEQEALLKGEITALVAAKNRDLNHMKELDVRAFKQREVIHDQEGHLQQLRRRLHDLTHDGNNNAVDVEQQKMLEFLQLRLQETSTTIKLLSKQLIFLKNSRTREQTNVATLEREATKTESEIATIKMSSDSAQRESIKLTEKREELMVDVSLTQLHLQRRLAQLQSLTETVGRMSQDKSDMEKLVSEQISGVQGRINAIEVAVRGLNAEMHTLYLQLHEVNTRVQQIKDKYKKVQSSLDNPEGEDEVSTTQVFLKVASERAGLQETGDMLDLEVRRAEEEVEALQQMVSLLNVEGQQYRSQIHQILHYSEEEKDRVILEENLASLEEEMAMWNSMHDQARREMESSQNKLHEVELQVHAVEELLREKNIHMTAVQRETESQLTKTRHAAQAVTTLQRRTRFRGMQQNDVELRLAQERLRMVNSLLGEAVSSYQEATEALIIYCQQVNVPPPDVIKLTKKASFGSRSSLGTLDSSRSSASSKARSVSPGGLSWKSRSRRSSVASLHSQDSGRSGSPDRGPRRSKSTEVVHVPPPVKTSTTPGLTLITPAFPSTDVKRQHYQGKKLSRRPTQHL
ncbi:coiled-coil domain-containing protein 39-like [Macrobrachium rosenbergii]|uniref:coiled-coil domain-containing protein 39-like n=1 Tax=Macrobrachium rosenbergii TaxID=79674 RepID=UPI0034D697A0